MSYSQVYQHNQERRVVEAPISIVLTLITVVLYAAVFGMVGLSVVQDLRAGDVPGASMFER